MTLDPKIDRIHADLLEFAESSTSYHQQTMEEIRALTRQVAILTHQIGAMSEGLTEIRLTAERQERNIDRLVGIVETLVQREAS